MYLLTTTLIGQNCVQVWVSMQFNVYYSLTSREQTLDNSELSLGSKSIAEVLSLFDLLHLDIEN